jgi:hypothetical protein
MAAIQIQAMGVSLRADAQDVVLEQALQAGIPAPLTIVMVCPVVGDFFFVGSHGSLSTGRRFRCSGSAQNQGSPLAENPAGKYAVLVLIGG